MAMETTATEIILIKTPAECEKNYLRPSRLLGRMAPFGLLCLAAVAPGRIAVADSGTIAGIIDHLQTFVASDVKAIILSASPELDLAKVSLFAGQLRALFPGVCLGIGVDEAMTPAAFDFSLTGTGKTAVLKILQGEKLAGHADCRADDADSPLPAPGETFIDCGYDIAPEKWLNACTLEILQPWQGLLDTSIAVKTWPGLDWVAGFIGWLKSAGVSSFHFGPSGLACKDLQELRSLMLKFKSRFSVSFCADDPLDIGQIGWPLQQVWVYNPSGSSADGLTAKIRHIHEAGFEACLQLDRRWLSVAGQDGLLGQIDRLVVGDADLWPFGELKKLMLRYWSAKNRFFRRLFSVRSASELVMFMKTSYMVLETIFSSDRQVDK